MLGCVFVNRAVCFGGVCYGACGQQIINAGNAALLRRQPIKTSVGVSEEKESRNTSLVNAIQDLDMRSGGRR